MLLKFLLHLAVYNNYYMHELKSASATILRHGIRIRASLPWAFLVNGQTMLRLQRQVSRLQARTWAGAQRTRALVGLAGEA
jgi:hypothetical protein